MAEAFRAGLQSVAKGQIDSAKVLVYNRLKFLDMSFSLKRLPFQFRQ